MSTIPEDEHSHSAQSTFHGISQTEVFQIFSGIQCWKKTTVIRDFFIEILSWEMQEIRGFSCDLQIHFNRRKSEIQTKNWNKVTDQEIPKKGSGGNTPLLVASPAGGERESFLQLPKNITESEEK
jgi:hypothetical protein